MKLHLPKSLLVAVLATMVSFTQSAWGEELTLLKDGEWTTSVRSGNISFDSENGTVYMNNGGWGQQLATCVLDNILEATTDTALTFSINIFTNASRAGGLVFGVALVGTNQTIVLGDLDYEYTKPQYGTSTDTTSQVWIKDGQDWNNNRAGAEIDNYHQMDSADSYTAGQTYTYGGSISWDETTNAYMLALTYNNAAEPVATLNLGSTADVERVVLYADGWDVTYSGLTLSGTAATIVELVWGGTEGNNTWSASSTPWGGDATSSVKTDVTFGTLSEAISDTVIISGDVTARSVVVNDDYTFQADGTAGISTDRGITIASGKILNISGGTLEVTGTMAGEVSIADNAALSLLEQTSITGLKVTGGTGAALNLDIPLDVAGDGRVILSEGSRLDRINVTGMMAYNMNGGVVTSNLGGADLHLANNGVLLIRNGNGDVLGNLNETANIGDIHFDGEVGEIRVYGSVSKETNAVIDNNITAAGKLQKTDGGYITLSGVVNATEIISSNTHWGGGTLGLNGLTETETLMAKGGHINIGTEGSVSTDRLIANGGNITISGEVTTGQVRLKDESGTGTITVNTGGVLNVTGSTNDHSTNDSLMMAHYGTNQGGHLTSGLIIDGGELNAGDAEVLTSWDSAGYFKVKRGTATVKGINFWGKNTSVYGLVELGSADGDGTARLNIGDTGIKDFGTNDETVGVVFNLGNGTLGATANWATSSNSGFTAGKFRLIGTGTGTVVDTTDAVDKTTARHITFNNALTGDGKLVVDGKGSLTLTVAGDNTGDVTINSEATLKLQSGGEYTMTHNVAGAGTLQVESGTTLLSNSKSIASKLVLNGGTLELEYGVSLNVDSIKMSEGSVINMLNGGGGTLQAGITIDGSGTLKAGENGSYTEVEGSIGGSGSLKLQQGDYEDTWSVNSAIRDGLSVEANANVSLTSENTYTGGTTISGRTLTTDHGSALGTGKVSLEGGILKLAAALSVSAMDYVSESSQVQLQENNLEVTGTLSVGENVDMQITGTGTTTVNTLQLNAGASISTEGALSMTNLSMGSGSSMAANETIQLDGTLTLGSGIKLTGTLLTAEALAAQDKLALFSGITDLNFTAAEGVTYNSSATVAYNAVDTTVDLTDVFSVEDVQAGMYELTYSDGTLWASQMNIPEPATTTLSLLALAGLCARRRRKS